MSSKLFYLLSLHAFLIASVLYAIYLVSPKGKLLRAARWSSLGGLVIHSVPVLMAHVSGSSELGGAAMFYALLAWSIVLIHHLVRLRFDVNALGIVAAPLAVLFTTLALVSSGDRAHAGSVTQMPPWVAIHIVITTWGEALFGIAAAAGVLYLYQDWRLRHKKIHGGQYLPDLETLDTLGRRLVIYGFVLLTLGLGLGIGAAYAVDKLAILNEPLSIVFKGTWALYLALMTARSLGWIGARRAAWSTVFCFVVAVVALIGINLIGPGAIPAHRGMGG